MLSREREPVRRTFSDDSDISGAPARFSTRGFRTVHGAA